MSNVTTSEDLTPEFSTQSWSILKDGTCTFTLSNVDGLSLVYSGNWMFVGKNKDLDLKNKEAISISVKSAVQTEIDGTYTYSNTGVKSDVMFVIDQLKGKEMIWKSEYTSSSYYGNGLMDSNSTTTTLTAK